MTPFCHYSAVNRTDRLYALGEELRRAGRRGRTAGQLAQRYEVSTRTIKRDVSALQQSGFPLWAQPGPGGGYVVDDRASLPAVNLTPTQAIAIAVALATNPSGPLHRDGRAALDKLFDLLGPSAKATVAELSQRVWVSHDGQSAMNHRAVHAIEQALIECRVVTINYRDSTGNTSTRSVEPQLLARTNDHWFLAAWCRLRQAPRWFRYDRIVAARLTKQTAPRRDLAIFGTPPPDAEPVNA